MIKKRGKNMNKRLFLNIIILSFCVLPLYGLVLGEEILIIGDKGYLGKRTQNGRKFVTCKGELKEIGSCKVLPTQKKCSEDEPPELLSAKIMKIDVSKREVTMVDSNGVIYRKMFPVIIEEKTNIRLENLNVGDEIIVDSAKDKMEYIELKEKNK